VVVYDRMKKWENIRRGVQRSGGLSTEQEGYKWPEEKKNRKWWRDEGMIGAGVHRGKWMVSGSRGPPEKAKGVKHRSLRC
ncbi:hypothetical protein HAX54_040332, partial [Datura stramonium]|nr:hypothetical protein [Datura stramonium]